ncbi:HAD family hydrolase [Sorangium sp. So ce131]|uniref:HAD family hydrolase n=1 Tax=Sorangium sp. So ce131 TaxID=3133282 RepID=UPI003F634F53
MTTERNGDNSSPASAVIKDSTKLAILDVDGTLYPGALGVELLRALMKGGLCRSDKGEAVLDVLRRYRAREIDFATMSVTAYGLFGSALRDCPCSEVERTARDIWERERSRLFPFASELVNMLKDRGCEPMLISGSPQEMVGLVAEELGVDDFRGSLFSRRSGLYTGEVELSSGVLGEKERILSAITGGKDVCLRGSMAIGDSLTDSALLRLVGKPIAFEPDPELLSLALHHGWMVADRDSILESAQALLG